MNSTSTMAIAAALFCALPAQTPFSWPPDLDDILPLTSAVLLCAPVGWQPSEIVQLE